MKYCIFFHTWTSPFATPLAANHKNFTCQKQESEPYLLYVGPLDKRKNVLGL